MIRVTVLLFALVLIISCGDSNLKKNSSDQDSLYNIDANKKQFIPFKYQGVYIYECQSSYSDPTSNFYAEMEGLLKYFPEKDSIVLDPIGHTLPKGIQKHLKLFEYGSGPREYIDSNIYIESLAIGEGERAIVFKLQEGPKTTNTLILSPSTGYSMRFNLIPYGLEKTASSFPVMEQLIKSEKK